MWQFFVKIWEWIWIIKIQKGLRQEDPLSTFLFVFVQKGLTALVRKSVEMGDFKSFKYGEEEFVDILQFTDDTVILGESSCNNLWSIIVLLRGFELISGLKINFSKSNVFYVNIGDWLVNSPTSFLSCKRGDYRFLFLGIVMEESPRKKKVWMKVLNNFKNRLSLMRS